MADQPEPVIDLRVHITRRQRRLLKIYQLQRDLPTKDAALQEILQKFFDADERAAIQRAEG
jgi:hypothetical protein